ncbi:MAG: LysM domain-containing protein [Candidatus Pacearchaeota archaeon]
MINKSIQYVVKQGDTLSAIAKKYGVKITDITGYKSGNPNIIYPGETLIISQSKQQTSEIPSIFTQKPVDLLKQQFSQPIIQQQPKQAVNIQSPNQVKIGKSYIEAGKESINELTSLGLSSDDATIQTNWKGWGLENQLGKWVGSDVQWRVYANEAKKRLEQIATGVQQIQQKITSLKEETSGKLTPETASPIPEKFSPSLTQEDLSQIIDKIARGEYTTPELEIKKEAINLQKQSEQERVKNALSSMEEEMASRGMTFSGIRNQEEERIMSEHLANMAGISLNLAAAIISAARDEEKRREPQIREFNDSLYAIYPNGNTVELIKGTKNLEKATIGGRLYEKNLATGEWEVKIDDPSLDIATELVGSSDSGYYLVSYNKKTGTVVKQQKVAGGASDTAGVISPAHYALAEMFLSNPSLTFNDIPSSQMAGFSLALQEKVKTLDKEERNVEKINQKLEIANRLGRVISLTDNELRLLIQDDVESGYDYDKIEEAINSHYLTNATKIRAKNILKEMSEEENENKETFSFPSIFRWIGDIFK